MFFVLIQSIFSFLPFFKVLINFIFKIIDKNSSSLIDKYLLYATHRYYVQMIISDMLYKFYSNFKRFSHLSNIYITK